MSLLKSGQIINCCHPNALITLREYLDDYASPQTQKLGNKVIEENLDVISNPKVRELTQAYLGKIDQGQRDFRF